MTTPRAPEQTDLTDLAAQALAARRAAQAVVQAARRALPAPLRDDLDAYLGTPPEHVFSAAALSAGAALVARLEAAADRAGGAPCLAHTEEGDVFTHGGTPAGGRIAHAGDHLARFLETAGAVHDRLVAERAVACQRAALRGRVPAGAATTVRAFASLFPRARLRFGARQAMREPAGDQPRLDLGQIRGEHDGQIKQGVQPGPAPRGKSR